ncbi:pep-cterm sorting domain-containing protein [Anaeramoeba ignava]|uniref:Pep-cterm sorting domain-containing protein n=1 Tax=Anaeramoeba ignava TaxID=1746090 RepID=A0A9Q0LCL6_ANAIG|nr:pep-cterm sorting domain-containing protein [Anaeramoeba ignava]
MDNNNQNENANQNQNQNENEKFRKKNFSIFVEKESNPFEIKVHKSILSSRSPFFNESLRQESLSISLNQFNKKEMESILNSISKQDFDKLKQFDIFLPNSFLIDIERTIFEIQDQENQTRIKEKDKKIKRRDKRIKEKDKKIKSFESETQNLKNENEKKEKEVEDKNKEIEKMKPVFDKYQEQYQQYLEYELKKKLEEIKKNFPQFSNSKIIQDIEYVKKLQEWINDNKFFSKIKKGFSAKKDGFDSQKLHSKCDNKGKTLVIIKTKDNFIFGGFTQVGFTNDKSKWSEKDTKYDWGFIPDSNAFIFSLRNDKGDRKPEKFTIKQGEEKYAIFYHLNYGPTFGGIDISLYSSLQSGYSNFGQSYNLPNGIKEETDEVQSYLAGSWNKWEVDELESYFI